MPPKRSARNGITATKEATRKSTRRKAPESDEIPDVYKDLLIEARRENPEQFYSSSLPAKRRKIAQDNNAAYQANEESVQSLSSADVNAPTDVPDFNVPNIQLTYNDDVDDADSDAEFEDVDFAAGSGPNDESEGVKDVNVNLSTSQFTSRSTVQRRKPVTKAERDLRLLVHKCHLICLLMHVAVRNHWCNDEILQKSLKHYVPRKWISRLHHEGTQLERKTSFDSAVQEICKIWRAKWHVSAQGLRRAYWREHIDLQNELDTSEDMNHDEFRDAAKSCSGSRDLGAQLLCALLRSLAVETRLVCSLQAVPFSRVAKGETPQKTRPTYIQAGNQNFGTSRSSRKKEEIEDSAYPVWWVEVYSPTIDQWVPIDSLVRNTINKPRTGFEPPASDALNSMSYVVAFDEDGKGKDVTIRYTSSYNAKTIRTRVESTKNGKEWYASVMRFFDKGRELRDQIEDAALDHRLAQEGMPKNVQDFKNHPIYVLERHLRANEVIEPKREIGKFLSGKNAKVESVYRRQDVHSCRSADSWYRKGKDIKLGEQPLKRVPKRRGLTNELEDADDDAEGVALYAEYQTTIYVPPPVVDGCVPRNGYGNLDVYVSSMIPAGGVHVRHPLAEQAAKVLGVDAATAVVGFKFKGRQGTAVLDGVVVDERNTASMIETTAALEDELDADLQAQRSAIISTVWKKMHTVLSMRQRLQDEYGGLSDGADDDSDNTSYHDDIGGGFFAGDTAVEPTSASKAEEKAHMSQLKDRQPIILPELVNRQKVTVVRSPHKRQLPKQDSVDMLFAYDSDGEADNSARDEGIGVANSFTNYDLDTTIRSASQDGISGQDFADVDEQGGGFVPEGEDLEAPAHGQASEEKIQGADLAFDEDTGGGFLPEEESEGTTLANRADSSSHDPGKGLNGGRVASTAKVADIPDHQTSLKPISQGAKAANRRRKRKDQELEYNHTSETEASELSHDPGEDEADMQWVDDAFEG